MKNYYEATTECCQRKVCCDWIPVMIFSALFTLVLGLILGATGLAATILENTVAFILVAVLLFLLAAVFLVIRLCACRRRTICE